jgi:hypothetical protein
VDIDPYDAYLKREYVRKPTSRELENWERAKKFREEMEEDESE